LKKNYKTLSLTITDGTIDKIIHSKNYRELEKNYRILQLTITNGITDGLNPSESFKKITGLSIGSM